MKKKKFEKPTLETCEYVVAARLFTSGTGGGHSNGQPSLCSKKSSAAPGSCADPASSDSSIANDHC